MCDYCGEEDCHRYEAYDRAAARRRRASFWRVVGLVLVALGCLGQLFVLVYRGLEKKREGLEPPAVPSCSASAVRVEVVPCPSAEPGREGRGGPPPELYLRGPRVMSSEF